MDQEFMTNMIPYVKFLAQRIAAGLPPVVELDDLVNYGVIGLLDACRKYDVSKGAKFKTYAETRIRGSILDGMRVADWVPRSVRPLRRRIEEARRLAAQDVGGHPSRDDVAKRMGMPVEELDETLLDVQGLSLVSLRDLYDGSSGQYQEQRIITKDPDHGNPEPLVQREQLREIVAKAVGELPEKERLICSLYYYDELTMKEIGMTIGVSESRVSQLHTKAMLRIRARLEELLDNGQEAY